MRLKSFTAGSMAEAMQMIRKELGEDAIIVSTQRAAGGKGVRITAALEQSDADDAVGEMLSEGGGAAADAVKEALESHGMPQRLVERLVNAARATELPDPTLALAAALESGFTFAPLPEQASPRPFMLIGPPGAGKSLAVAKLAARAVMKRRKVSVITADNMRAGATAQLAAFTRILQIELVPARGPDGLRKAMEKTTGADLVFIDSPGLNAFRQTDMEFLSTLAEAADVEPILVLAAGGDITEAAEMAEAFGGVGATRLLATRLDTTRRLGGIMAAADAAQLMLSEVSANPHVANGLNPVSPVLMARMMVPQAPSAENEEKFWTEALQ